MISRAPARPFAALVIASVALLGLGACTAGEPPTLPSAATQPATPPQASIDGEWVVTRTVVSSDDVSNPARVVGAESVRYLSITREDCGDALCEGTVASGSSPESREATGFTQVDGGLEYELTGALDCLNVTTGGVLAVDGFEFSQRATLGVADSVDVAGTDTATKLTGVILYSDTLSARAAAVGCERAPATVNVEYSVTAVRPA
jgi:hypothetical protein